MQKTRFEKGRATLVTATGANAASRDNSCACFRLRVTTSEPACPETCPRPSEKKELRQAASGLRKSRREVQEPASEAASSREIPGRAAAFKERKLSASLFSGGELTRTWPSRTDSMDESTKAPAA